MGNFKLNSKNIFIIFILFFCGKIFSQDTIYFRNSEVKSVKVNEVNPTEIKYFRFESLSGPIYTSYTNEIKKIKYAGGHVDSFNVVIQKPNVIQTKNVFNNSKIEIVSSKNMYYETRRIGDDKILTLILSYHDKIYSEKMMLQFIEMKKYQNKQHLFGFIGLGLGLSSILIGVGSSIGSYGTPIWSPPLYFGLAIGGTILLTGLVNAEYFKSKRIEKKLLVADMYNRGLQQ